MMKAQDIERVEFAELNLDSERESLGAKAASLLGYRRLHRETTTSLLSTLKQLGIEPLVPLQVSSYKNSKEREGMWSGKKVGIIHLALCLCSGAGVVRAANIASANADKKLPVDGPM